MSTITTLLQSTPEMSHFNAHLKAAQEQVNALLAKLKIESLVIGSGVQEYYFQDDQYYPFKSHPFFRYFCPIEGPYHLLHFQAGHTPRVLFYAPDDYWYVPSTPENNPFLHAFSFEVVKDKKQRFALLSKPSKGSSSSDRLIFIGSEDAIPDSYERNPKDVLQALACLRTCKSLWEAMCVGEATRIALKGHKAIEKGFLEAEAGSYLSERDIYYIFQQATGAIASEFPYPPIIAMDYHGAYLHYDQRSSERTYSGMSLLVDAGAEYMGYASDISRTYLRALPSSHSHYRTIAGQSISQAAYDVFAAMLQKLHSLQEELVTKHLKVGMLFKDWHEISVGGIYKILADVNLISGQHSPEQQHDIARAFYPHGLGHMLGLQVHDVHSGSFAEGSESKSLRLKAEIADGHIFTVEPGIYFIPSLIKQLECKHPQIIFQQALLQELIYLGGMRVEDNIYICQGQPFNITRLQ